jgi:manganese/zinc/iron transport system substrate-binding protein
VIRVWLALVLISCLILGCDSPRDELSREKLQKWMSPNGKIKVLSTIAMIDDLVNQIGREHIDTLILIQGELDPHSYQLVKGDDEKLSNANIIFCNGLGLEHGASLRSYLETNSKTIFLGDKIRNANGSLILDYNGSVDPHIWMDISLWAKIVPYIVETFVKLDSAHADAYRANGEKIYSQMLIKHNQLKDEMLQIPPEKRFLVTSHDAFNYFARAYLATPEEIGEHNWQKRFVAPEGLSPESQLNPVEIRLIMEHAKKYNVSVVFPEANVSQSSIRKLINASKEQGLNLCIVPEALYSDTLGKPGSLGDTYLKMVEYNVKTIIKYFTKNNCNEK